MSRVDLDFPVQPQTNGTKWYRPAAGEGTKLWGWTSDFAQAHPDYAMHDQPEETTEVTELIDSDVIGRFSEFCRFPLPPFPESVNVDTDGWQRYKLPHPTTGKITAYTRATTVAKTTPDNYKLERWKQRMKGTAILRLTECIAGRLSLEPHITQEQAVTHLSELVRLSQEDNSDKRGGLGSYLDLMDDLTGGAEAREHGGCIHDWLAELAMGRVLLHQIPEIARPHCIAYQDAMGRAGLVDVPEYTERIVLNMKGIQTIAGRLDGIALCVETGEYVLIDRKTGKTLEFSTLEQGIQLAVYGYADLMLLPDRSGWEPMPEISTTQAFIIHVPSDQPERSQVVPYDMYKGAQSMMIALDVREDRSSAKARLLGGSYPIPSEASLRYVAARQRLQNLQDLDDAIAVQQEYEDVWTDDLTEFGAQCFGLINRNTDTEG